MSLHGTLRHVSLSRPTIQRAESAPCPALDLLDTWELEGTSSEDVFAQYVDIEELVAGLKVMEELLAPCPCACLPRCLTDVYKMANTFLRSWHEYSTAKRRIYTAEMEGFAVPRGRQPRSCGKCSLADRAGSAN